jgi:hypothetical protein
MDSRWDGHERRRGQSPEELREHLRECRVAWESKNRQPQPDATTTSPTMDVHRDNDEERRARVEAILETLQATENVTRKAVLR